MASIDPECLVYLTNAVRHEDAKIRAHAALALARLKTNGFPAFPVLLTCLSDNDKSVRVNAVWALEEIAKTKPEVALPFLDDALHDTNTVARLLILKILGGLGERARPAVPTILVSAKEKISAVRDAAVKALKQIQPEALKELDGM